MRRARDCRDTPGGKYPPQRARAPETGKNWQCIGLILSFYSYFWLRR
jgi:hypothetical protein